MKLHTLKRSKGIVSKAKRLGRGNASGKGNYSTKGLNWQKARSGFWMKPFFEGGQTSIVMRIPKARGFKRYYKLVKEIAIVNLGALNLDERVVEWTEISKALLKSWGYIKDSTGLVKVLGNGDRSKKVTFLDIDFFSASAQKKIENPSASTTKEKATKTEKAPIKEKKAPVKKPATKAAPAKEAVVKEKKAVAKKAPVKKTVTKKAKPE